VRWLPPAALACLCCAAAGAGAEQGNWPRFRGPNGAGVSHANTIPAKWGAGDYNWKIELPGVGHSSPAVWGNRLFVTCSDARTARRTILCLDPATGKTLWRRDYPSKPFRQHRDNSYAAASPAADAYGVVVTWSTPDAITLLALDNAGNEAWRRDLGPWVGNHGTGASPIIADGLVVLASDQEDPKAAPGMYGRNPKIPAGKSCLVALDRRTGATRWRLDRRTRLAAYSTPCLSTSLDGKPELILTSTAHGITGVDLATGRVNWEVAGIFRDRCIASPVVAHPGDGKGPPLVIGGYGQGSSGDLIVAVRPGLRAKGIEPKVLYRLGPPVPLVPTPLVKGRRLFLWCDNGTVACHDAQTGKLLWRGRVRGSFYGSPVWVDGRLYCIAKNGDVFVLRAGDKFELLARVPLGEASFATPAVAGGAMFLRTRTRLLSLGGKRP